MSSKFDVTSIAFDERGLVPAVVQDWRDGSVLMVAWMNREALTKTMETGSVHFFSRSRNRLWEKGETSGNRLVLKELFLDCDGDTLLVKVEPVGPTCHTGRRACFFRPLGADGTPSDTDAERSGGGVLERVYEIVLDRKRRQPAGSYVTSLFEAGQDKILKKIAEEAGEVILASKGGKREEIVYEVADLLFHTLTALGYHEIRPEAIYAELASRYGTSGVRKGEAAKRRGEGKMSGTQGGASSDQRQRKDRRARTDRRVGLSGYRGPERRKGSRRTKADRRGGERGNA